MSARIRVLVVEDSLTVRKHLIEILSADPQFEIVGEAEDGQMAIDLCSRLRPDVVTLDMVLPGLSGLAVTEHVMAHFPTPILVVSASTNRGELFQTYQALAAGAVEAFDKPTGHEDDAAWIDGFRSLLKVVSRIKVITHPRLRLGLLGRAPRPGLVAAPQRPAAIAIGASTGGPGAMVEILKALPAPYPLPILLVVHLGAPFGTAFADWLDAQSGHGVSYAVDGTPLREGQGRVLMAPPDRHLELRDGRLWLSAAPERFSCRPSVDVLFESVARELGASGAGVLLTGMGRDGGAGLLQMRRAGAQTIAQDEASCVVYGMPREAALLGAAQRILPLSEIAPALTGLAGPPR
jgi:two-component system chemotaxis response regulator CheB